MDPHRILDDLGIACGESIAITGTGGKTTLLWFLAGSLKTRGNVVVSVTAKMFPPEEPLYEQLLLDPDRYDPMDQPDHSIWLIAAGVTPAGKLLGITDSQALHLSSPNNYLVMEADGSRGLPLKMWYDHEPPVPPSASLTLGILPIRALGLPVSPETVYNFDDFSNFTGLKAGEAVTASLLADLILAPGGLFKNSKGRKILVINQCDDAEFLRQAELLCAAVLNHPRHHELTAIVCMSLKEFNDENYSHYTCRRIIPENETK